MTYKNRYLVVIGGETETKNVIQMQLNDEKNSNK